MPESFIRLHEGCEERKALRNWSCGIHVSSQRSHRVTIKWEALCEYIYIKVFDAAVLSAMAKMQASLETLQRGTFDCWPERSEIGQQAKRSIVVN